MTAWGACLLAGLAFAAEPAPPNHQPPEHPETTLVDDVKPAAPTAAGWARQSSSLLFYDESGSLANEIPLRTEESSLGSRVAVREVLGGACGNRRFSWTLERATTWNQQRTKALSSKRLLRVFGTNGKELWTSTEADSPETGEPLQFSADGETVLVALHGPSGWTASVRNFMGAVLIDVGPVPSIQTMTLTPNGKYAMVRWSVPEKSATHTFLEIPSKTRQDVPSDRLNLGLARVTEDGKVLSGKKVVLDFALLPKKP